MIPFESLFGKSRWIYWLGMLVLVTGIAIVLARRKSPEEIARQRLVWGDQALENHNYEQAIAFYRTALEKDPTLVSAAFNLALAYEGVDRAKAVAAWDDYIRRAGRDPAQADWLATAREHRGMLLAEPHLERGAAAAARGDHARARAEYEAALKFHAGSLKAMEGAAANETAGGDYPAAARYYERALEVAPYSLRLRYDLAGCYERYDKAKAAATLADLDARSQAMLMTEAGLTPEKQLDVRRRLAALRAEGYGPKP
jgi:tetratricopeptide (TPR) repeat protein